MALRLICLCFASLLVYPAMAESDATPQSYQATYTAKYSGMPVTATRVLKKTEQGYRIISSVKGMLGDIMEQEDFHIDERGHILTDHYLSEKAFFGSARSEELVVDHQAKKATYTSTRKNKHRELPLSTGYLGPLSYQLQLRNDLKASLPQHDDPAFSEQISSYQVPLYKVMSRGRIKDYQFEILGEETIDAGIGQIRTLKLQRVRKDNKRQTAIWVAPAWGFLIVKIVQQEKGGKHYEILVETATIDGEAVSLP